MQLTGKEKSMFRASSNIHVYREFEFASNILTICADNQAVLTRALGAKSLPIFATTIVSHPVATYLPVSKLSSLKSPYQIRAKVSGFQVSAALPEKWLVGLTDGVKVYSLAVIPVDEVLELAKQVELSGSKIVAFPVPNGRVV